MGRGKKTRMIKIKGNQKAQMSPLVMESGFHNSGNFCLWNPESWAPESGKQLKKSGIPLTIGIQNPSSTDKDWNPVPGIRNPPRGIFNPRLSRILLFEATNDVLPHDRNL